MRPSFHGFHRLALITAIATFALVIVGGAVKATGAGAACPDWPTCQGHVLPALDAPTLLAFGHRLLALVVAVLALLTLAAAWRLRQYRRPVFLGSLLAIGLLGVQIVLSGLSVLGGLPAVAVTGILGVGLAFFALILTLTIISDASLPGRVRLAENSAWLLPFSAAAAAYVTMLLGGYMKSAGASLACSAWPLCQPGMILPAITNPWAWLSFLHRLAALATGILASWAIYVALRKQGHQRNIAVAALVSALFYIMQVGLGAIDVAFLGPASIGMLHLATATALFASLVVLAVQVYRTPPLAGMSGGSHALALPQPWTSRPLWRVAGDLLLLWKPRVQVLLLITAYGGMWVAAGGPPSLRLTFWTLLGLAFSTGGANSVNMWYDQDIDVIMRRTRNRPVPAGRLDANVALAWGLLCGVVAFLLLSQTVSYEAALYSLAGYLFYVFIYTMWLKRSTPQNIVIGGAAGAFPPVVGWAAVQPGLHWAPWLMFAIIFLWTPPHFWALALYKQDDYRSAGIPMLPVVRGEGPTKWQSLLYAVLLLPASLLLYWTGSVGKLYLVASTVLGVAFIGYCVVLLREKLPAVKVARATFKFSLLYLTLVFAAMVIDARRLLG